MAEEKFKSKIERLRQRAKELELSSKEDEATPKQETRNEVIARMKGYCTFKLENELRTQIQNLIHSSSPGFASQGSKFECTSPICPGRSG